MADLIEREALIQTINDSDLGTGFKVALISAVQNAPAVSAEREITGETSDGYHTFNELYHHRAVLFSVICSSRPDIAWKSLQHDDPAQPMYDGMFICGIQTPEGQATYHYDIEPYWDMFRVPMLERAPKWDGHTPAEAIRRIGTLSAEREGELISTGMDELYAEFGNCSVCGGDNYIKAKYCNWCGAKMRGAE